MASRNTPISDVTRAANTTVDEARSMAADRLDSAASAVENAAVAVSAIAHAFALTHWNIAPVNAESGCPACPLSASRLGVLLATFQASHNM